MFKTETIIGFTLSALLHAGAAATYLSYGGSQNHMVQEQKFDLNLAVFQEEMPQSDDLERISEPEIKKPAPIIKTKEINPFAKKITPPLLETEPEVEPEPKLEKETKPLQQPKTTPSTMVAPLQIAPATPSLNAGIITSHEAEYQAALHLAVLNEKYYPRRAKKMRQQGTVLVKFTLFKDGTLHHLEILKSSNVTALDQAALKAVRKAAKFPPFPSAISRQSWSFEILLEYEIS